MHRHGDSLSASTVSSRGVTVELTCAAICRRLTTGVSIPYGAGLCGRPASSRTARALDGGRVELCDRAVLSRSAAALHGIRNQGPLIEVSVLRPHPRRPGLAIHRRGVFRVGGSHGATASRHDRRCHAGRPGEAVVADDLRRRSTKPTAEVRDRLLRSTFGDSVDSRAPAYCAGARPAHVSSRTRLERLFLPLVRRRAFRSRRRGSG
jgi:hypothetical protein